MAVCCVIYDAPLPTSGACYTALRGRGAAPGLFDQFPNSLPVGLLTLACLFSFLG